jgi:hypothetical protein
MGVPVAYLYCGQPASSDAALYTASGVKVFPSLVAVNPTVSAVTLSLSVVRSISGVTETICSGLSVPAFSAVSLLDDPRLAMEEVLLDPGDALHGSVSGTAPAPPVPTKTNTGGTVLTGTYGVKVTYVSASGETLASAAGTVTTVADTSTITIPSPAPITGATGWYAYVTQVGGSTYTRQQTAGSPTAIGTGLTLTAPPTSSGAQAPTTAGCTITAF